jgi:4-phospho-D-threonate 3-dehydrogenase / 4-phospho-D-erythronate 3-dehydrogenase
MTVTLPQPILALTMGDAAGIGPEIIVKAHAALAATLPCRLLVVGDANRLADAVRLCGLPQQIVRVQQPAATGADPHTLYCYDLALIPFALPYGEVAAIAGECAYQAIATATRWALAGEVAALVTAPLNKTALHAAGYDFPGHTEILAHLAGVEEVSLMMARPDLRVIHVTMHLGLLAAIALIAPPLVFRTIARAQQAMQAAGILQPRIAVCGINPHAGENGLFGAGEEAEKILPAIQQAQAQGWAVSGPHPADTVFYRARRGDFDIVVAMYHDQGLAPIKVLGIDAAVNITVGLPVIRTSVGHGTAFDIAGHGLADPAGMIAAITAAWHFSETIESAQKPATE